jgi:hypothetical protein
MSQNFSRYQIIKMASHFLTGTAAMIAVSSGLTLIADTASASVMERDFGCEAGGFTGTIRINFNVSSSGRVDRIRSVAYKINKGNNSGGNKANITFSDGGTLPSKNFNSGDKGIQDNEWHYLNIGEGYTRGNGGVSVRFVFDKRGSDPSCTKNIRL